MFKEVWFERGKAIVGSDEMYKVSEVVTYIQQNPSIRVGIDTFSDPDVATPYDRALRQRRVDAVRDALINAGLPAYKLQANDIGLTRYSCTESFDQCRRVGVLINSGN